MKKTFLYLLTALSALTVSSCSKEAEQIAAPVVCKYTLPSVSASLDNDSDTRTSLDTNYVVNWSNNDRIAIINTATNTKYQYALSSGVDTSVGQFVPVDAAATYDNIGDLKAVYPAMAATVENGTISFSFNTDYDETVLTQYGITSWTNDSPYSFANNDIKVSHKADLSNGKANFKFKQLATWCCFTFDFTKNVEYSRESLQGVKIENENGKLISGTAAVNIAGTQAPMLSAGTETTVDWTLDTPLSLASPADVSLALLPVVDA